MQRLVTSPLSNTFRFIMAARQASTAAVPRLEQGSTALFVCDIQERFTKAIHSFDAMVDASSKLLRGAQILKLPVYTTEQNPKGVCVVLNERRKLTDLLAPVSTRIYRRSATTAPTPGCSGGGGQDALQHGTGRWLDGEVSDR